MHEPFDQLDGALVRIRVPGGILAARDLRHVAEVVSAHGSALEITSRANLQIRGVTPQSHRHLVRDLVGVGLALADVSADARRNVLASPTAGCDPHEVTDTRALVATASAVLADCVGVSPKFGVLIDGGGLTHVRGRRQDISLGALKLHDGYIGYEVRLAEALPERPENGTAWVVAPHDAGDLLAGALELMAERVEAKGRMADLVALRGRVDVLDDAASRRGVRLRRVPPPAICARSEPSHRPIGALPQRQVGLSMVGAMPLLGRLSAEACGDIADVATAVGARGQDAEVRLTPWRSVLIPNVATEQADAALAALEELGLAVVESDPALSVVACAGSAGCPASYTDTQRDGLAVVAALRAASSRLLSVHLSGCAKRCADGATEFDVTLVGGPTPGSYEVTSSRDASLNPTGAGIRVEANTVAEHIASMARSGDA